MMSHVKSIMGLLLVLFLWDGCGANKSQQALVAEQAYTADLLSCVNKSETLATSKECRKNVDARWGVMHGTH